MKSGTIGTARRTSCGPRNANQFVVAEVAGLPAGRALDLAAGEGRNAVWLAEQGWHGDRGRLLGRWRSPRPASSPPRGASIIETVVADVTEPLPGQPTFDLVARSRTCSSRNPTVRARWQCRGRGRAGRHAPGRRARRHQPRARLRRPAGPRRAHRPRAGRCRPARRLRRSRRPNGSNGGRDTRRPAHRHRPRRPGPPIGPD